MTTVIIPLRTLYLIFLTISLIIGITAAADSRYLSGAPDIRAAIEGRNEFIPGEELDLVLFLENHGSDTVKILQQGGTSGPGPSTAWMVSAKLRAGDAPLIILADPQMVGTLQAGKGEYIPFRIKVMPNATGGEYQIPLDLRYTRISSEEFIGADSIIFHYAGESQTLIIPIGVKDVISIKVPKIQAQNLTAGGEGYLVLHIQNIGSLAGKKAIARIFQGDQSPIIPVTENVYIGDFPPKTIQEAKFKVMVEETAEEKIYPMFVTVEYEDSSGETFLSRNFTIGVPVIGKTKFFIVDGDQWMYRGARQNIEITYENGGAVPVYSAQARISAVEPFGLSDDTSFLGDLPPGQRGVARFEIEVDKAATIKEYGLDTEIRYRDELNQSRISDPIRVSIEVKERLGVLRILYNPVLMSIIIAIIIGASYYFRFYRRSGPRKPEDGTG